MTMNASLNDSMNHQGTPISYKIPKASAYALLFVVSTFGNSFIICTIYKDIRLRTNTNVLVANMAVSDFLYALFNCPESIVGIMFDGQWMLDGDVGLVFCKLVPFVSDVSDAVSLYSCVFIAIDRYVAVAHPLKGSFSRSRLKYIIPAIWVASSVVISPYLYYFKLVKTPHSVVKCIYDDPPVQYLISVLIFSIGLTAPAITIIYALIVYKLFTHKVPGVQNDSANRRREKQNRNILKLSLAIVLPLYVTELVLVITLLMNMFGHLRNMSNKAIGDLFFTTVFLKRTSIANNFFVYFIFNVVYRENFKKFISKCRCIKCTCFRAKLVISKESDRIEMNNLESGSSMQVLSIPNLAYDSSL